MKKNLKITEKGGNIPFPSPVKVIIFEPMC